MTEPVSTLDDLLEQEQRLVFDGFDNLRGIALGLHLLEAAKSGKHPVTIDVTRHDQQLFHAALPGTSPDNDRWIERKRAVVERFAHSSLYMRRLCDRDGTDLASRFQLDPLAYAAHGGSFPIIVRGVGVVGSATISGLPHEVDHAVLIQALDSFLSAPGSSEASASPADFHLSPGEEVVLHRVVTEADVEAFADLSGDRSPNHVDAEAMASSVYQGRIAHGALLIAFVSACSTAIVERIPQARQTETPVSLGYDRIRFIKPAYIGDALTLRYVVRTVDAARRRCRSDFTIHGAAGDLVCVGEHILKWVS